MHARVLRVGKAVTLAHCEILDAGRIAAVQVGVYGLARSSLVTVKPPVVQAPRRIEDIQEMRFDPERTPPFLQHYWESKRLPWLHIADDLPRFAELPPAPADP